MHPNQRCIFLGQELPPAVAQGRKSLAVALTHCTQKVKRTVLGGIKPVVWWFFKKNVSSHTDVVGEAMEILQSVSVVVVLDDILYSLVAVLIATTLRFWLMASLSL